MYTYKVKFGKEIKIKHSFFGINILDMKPISTAKVRIYISGAITRDIMLKRDWQSKFIAYELFLKRFFPNAEFVNPGRLTPGEELKPKSMVEDLSAWQYRQVMTRDLTNLMTCDIIALMPDLKYSPGAKCEKEVAECLGIKKIRLPWIPILNYL